MIDQLGPSNAFVLVVLQHTLNESPHISVDGRVLRALKASVPILR
jgi:hypothetical protein